MGFQQAHLQRNMNQNLIPFQLKPTQGKSIVKIENIVYYDGAWEVHSKENGYNADCIYQTDMVFDKDRKIDLLFDLTNGAQILSND